MPAFKEIQKGNFITWTDEHGKITRFYRLNEKYDVAGDFETAELTVAPNSSVQTFEPGDGKTYTKVTVLAGTDIAPTVEDEVLIYSNTVIVDGGVLNV